MHLLFTQLPMFQRQGAPAYKANLEATKKVCRMLGNPEKHLKFVHVAGTNGKGTVSHMLAAAFQLSGHKVGLFSSPHLVDFRERIRVNGQCIPESAVVAFVQQWQANEGWGTPSFFELTFGLALVHFQASQCDVVVLETGMGGRLDSTNVIPTAELCVVTNIGLDHQQFLGPDIRSIAREKAGIFKASVPVVLGPMRPEAQSEMLQAALRTSSEVHFAAEKKLPSAEGSVRSPFDEDNRKTASMALQVLRDQGWMLDTSLEPQALEGYAALTGQRGRWEWVSLPGCAAVVLDGAHNVDAVSRLVVALEQEVDRRGGSLHVVWGAVSDKALDPVLDLLPSFAKYYWCQADVPRAMPASDLAASAPSLAGTVCPRPVDALASALASANERDVVWVGGSLFVVGDVLRDAPGELRGWPSDTSTMR